MRKLLSVLSILVLAGCSEKTVEPPKMGPEPAVKLPTPPAPPAVVKPPETAASKTPAPLLDPKHVEMTKPAPADYKVKFATSAGDFTVLVHRAWSPNGADRFHNLVRHGFYDGCRFFRVVGGFMAQIGIHGDPEMSAVWREASFKDDPVQQSNVRGMLSFATRGADTRTTQFFINFADNARLDGMGFSPFAKVVEGMDVVDKLHAGYGEGAPRGQGPDQGRLQNQGNVYLEKDFPKLDFVKTATIVP